MKITGIVAEYNPFHNGHAYQIEYCKKILHSDYIVVVMSGDFVQRGAPALVDKYTRIKMALDAGADLVLELPVLWSTASAEFFATAAVRLLDSTGIVDSICFGCETTDTNSFLALAELLNQEPFDYKESLSSALRSGDSFPAARLKAALSCFTELDPDVIRSILSNPNNILGLEYLRAISRMGSSMTPHLLQRNGASYHETDTNSSMSSASGIRKLLLDSSLTEDSWSSSSIAEKTNFITHTLKNLIPADSLNVLSSYVAAYGILTENDFSQILFYQLADLCHSSASYAGFHTHHAAELSDIADCNQDLANRIQKQLSGFLSYSAFCESLKSRELTYTRISRVLLHIILGITDQDYQLGKNMDYIPYLRVLGFKKRSSLLLRMMKEESELPLITRPKEAENLLSDDTYFLFQKDVFASKLYRQCASIKSGYLLPDEDHMPMLVR